MTDLVPQAFRDLLDFYTENHAEARFGDLDVSALQQAIASIDEAAGEVQAAEAALAQAKEHFRDVEAELLAKAGRAVSFLKIYVEQNADQVAQLEAIGSAIVAQRRKGKPGADTASAAPVEPRQRRTRKAKASITPDENQPSSPEVVEDALFINDVSELAPDASSAVTANASQLSRATTATLA
jgi:hypothetical protein